MLAELAGARPNTGLYTNAHHYKSGSAHRRLLEGRRQKGVPAPEDREAGGVHLGLVKPNREPSGSLLWQCGFTNCVPVCTVYSSVSYNIASQPFLSGVNVEKIC